MKLVPIFDGERSLLSFKFDGNETSIFNILFDQWTDTDYLFDFFEANKEDLQSPFWQGVSVEAAIEKTIQEANDLYSFIKDQCGKPTSEIYSALSQRFRHLYNDQTQIIYLEGYKAKASVNFHWLRLYAINVNEELFIITGGAIKLTKTMQDRKHTNKELMKLSQCKSFLQEAGISDADGIFDFMEI